MNDKNDTTSDAEDSASELDAGALADGEGLPGHLDPKIVDRSESGWVTVRLQRPMKNSNPEVDPSEIRLRSEVYAGDLFAVLPNRSNMENSIAVACRLSKPEMPPRFLARLHSRDAVVLQMVVDLLLGN